MLLLTNRKLTPDAILTIKKVVGANSTLFWFRRDLRLNDNAGLYHALNDSQEVIPVFIFDSVILEKLEDPADRRVEFIHHSLLMLQQELVKSGSSLLILHGNPIELFEHLRPKAVYCNHDYEPYATKRDGYVSKIFQQNNVNFKTCKDQVIFEKDEVIKDDGTPYSIFTPYSRKWKSTLNESHLKGYPSEKYFHHFKKLKPIPIPSLDDLGFTATKPAFPDRIIRSSIIEKYDTHRNYPGIQGTTRLSVHLRFGTISIRRLAQLAIKKNEAWLNELIWRDFYHMILWHFPRVETQAFKKPYDNIEWRNDPTEFNTWCEGRTGYPIVDAGMRELNATGFMHNRLRMITASFLTKHLLIDWRWGEAYFAQKLLDFDLAANNGGWQWASGSGCDAAPYFRVFNPQLQTEKFDPDFTYIKKWVPEFNTENYPKPIVEHRMARERVLRAYKAALGSVK